VTDTIVVSTPPLSVFVRGKHPKPLPFAPINTTTTLNVYFNCTSATYVLLSTSFSNKVWSFHGKEKDLAWIEASSAMKMRSALFWDTTAVIPEDRISRWITFMSDERGRQCREKPTSRRPILFQSPSNLKTETEQVSETPVRISTSVHL
jgi:hypothetical protein